jgi:LysM repeat protein
MLIRIAAIVLVCAMAGWISGAATAEASPVAQSQGSWGTQGLMHTVQWGDTLWGIARRYGTNVQAIQVANGLHSSQIYAGQRLVIPRGHQYTPVPQLPGGRAYVVRWGDTLWRIALRHGTTVGAIMRANGLVSHHIYAGQRLFVPIYSPQPQPTLVPTPEPQLPEVVISPWSGPPGTWVAVRLVRFPAWEVAQIRAAPYGEDSAPVTYVRTDGAGNAVTHVRADGARGVNLVISARTSGAGWARPTYASALFKVR